MTASTHESTASHALMAALLERNTAIISCDQKHLPVGLMLPLDGNTLQSERFRTQIEASEPLKKNLWSQTVKAKIENQSVANHVINLNIEGDGNIDPLEINPVSGNLTFNGTIDNNTYVIEYIVGELKTRISRITGEKPSNCMDL